MHAHIVLSHPEPQSFNAHLARVACRSLESQGWSASVSDLYAMGFDPRERAEHYVGRRQPQRFDVQAEQHHASELGTIPEIVVSEIDKLDRADLLILQYPMWWHLPPAMLKGWIDRVFIYGEVYASQKHFEKGRFVGKRAMLSVTVGTSEDTYAFDGRSGDSISCCGRSISRSLMSAIPSCHHSSPMASRPASDIRMPLSSTHG